MKDTPLHEEPEQPDMKNNRDKTIMWFTEEFEWKNGERFFEFKTNCPQIHFAINRDFVNKIYHNTPISQSKEPLITNTTNRYNRLYQVISWCGGDPSQEQLDEVVRIVVEDFLTNNPNIY